MAFRALHPLSPSFSVVCDPTLILPDATFAISLRRGGLRPSGGGMRVASAAATSTAAGGKSAASRRRVQGR
jgi:hypothetical protein